MKLLRELLICFYVSIDYLDCLGRLSLLSDLAEVEFIGFDRLG